MIHFSILGISVRVDPWFWITMALIGGGMRASSSQDFMVLAVFIFAGFLSVLVHELGHALTIRKFGLPTAITLQAFGGFASYPAGQLNRMQSFLVTFAGPAVQFALGILLIFVYQIIAIPEGSLFDPFMRALIGVSLIWSVLNCVPVYPLDGGQMLASILGPQRQKYVHITGAAAAVILGIFGYLYLGTLLFPIFMGLFGWQNWKAYQSLK